MSGMYSYLKARFGVASSDEGATAVEYGIMVALIAIVIIVAVIAVGQNLLSVFTEVAENLELNGAEG